MLGRPPRIRSLFRPALALAVVGLFSRAATAQTDVLLTKLTEGQDANVAPGPVLLVGAPVTWTYVVSNAGGRDLENVLVTDDQGVTVSCPATTVGAGESMICTGSGIVQAGQYMNLGTVTADAVGGGAVTASDPSHYFGQASVVITLVKTTNTLDANTPPGPVVAVGDPITWTYIVTNTGTEMLSNVAVSDDQGVVVTCPQTTLAPAESMACTANGTAISGQYRNLGTATAQLPDNSPVVATDVSHYFGQGDILDFGDADGLYPTTLLNMGPSHLLGSNVFLGACVDAELDGQLTFGANGDDQFAGTTVFGTCAVAGDDEDGVTLTSVAILGEPVAISVVANEPCLLTAWADWNGDGDWLDLDESLFPGGTPLTAGANALSFDIPADSVFSISTRFRCSTDGEINPTGRARDGEVEDYVFTAILPPATDIIANKVATLALDVNGNGDVNPGDRLRYTITITNNGATDLILATFGDFSRPNTTLVAGSVTTTQGGVVFGNAPGATSVWVSLGDVFSQTTATVEFLVTINDPLPPSVTSVDNQGVVSAINLANSVLTDDPALPGLQATVTQVLPNPAVTEIPTLGSWGLFALAAALGGFGLWRMRQVRA